MSAPRVRFAPSPTGPLHIGGVRTALYNYLFAKQHGGTFVLRIEDTDQNRFVEGAEEYIQEALEWCGLVPDESPNHGGAFGPYRQSERADLYQKATQRLLESGNAYYAFDTSEALDAARSTAEKNGNTFRYDASTRGQLDNSLSQSMEEVQRRVEGGEPYVVRLFVQPNDEVAFTDRVRDTVRFSTNELDDKVLMKADGLPTYHLANVVDDHAMEITHVIRGEEWLSSTAHHVLLYRAFGWENVMPEFAHLPLLLKPVGKGKLSKRDGAKFDMPVFPLEWDNKATNETFDGFRERGFLPEALINFLAFLGWNPGTEQEIFTQEELIKAFDLDRISKSGARFDFDRAKWFNQQYIMKLSDEDFANQAAPYIAQEVDQDFLQRIAPLMRERIQLLGDLSTEGTYLFDMPRSFDEKQAVKRIKKADLNQFERLSELLDGVGEWRAANISSTVKNWANEQEIKLGVLLPLYRIALTGGMTGPDVFELSEVIGKTETIARWDNALSAYKSMNVS